MYNMRKSGFTIIELMIAIAVIAILATLVIVVYSGVKEKAVESSTHSELSSNHKLVSTYKVDHAKVPEDVNPQCNPLGSLDAEGKLCLASSEENDTFEYSRSSDDEYVITVTRGAQGYSINQDGIITEVEEDPDASCEGLMFCSQ